MNLDRTVLRRAAAAAGCAAAVLTAVLVPAGAAQAATPGQFTLCSDGYYSSYAEFPGRHLATKIVAPGTCSTLNLSGNTKEFVVLHQDNGAIVGSFSYDDAAGTGVSTTGNSWSTGYYRW
ncbi:hypothetical protein [Streptomyces sp. CB01881]|uniref:hypothetical protein n=1 Tax=Streptomyces sp. CB01881 TaxID=2078691 RepID=UPI000CDC7008|nr:hypothetical protein [Streptomyces sp. CB01881]AUY53467.1 hypothetical protein C2142_36445 [Streptomyces sp. CB01881]TYC69616.1 hypothetical protein EH183_36485 [Streptomyces sp. CB01881]